MGNVLVIRHFQAHEISPCFEKKYLQLEYDS
jgi:hypothetical protein